MLNVIIDSHWPNVAPWFLQRKSSKTIRKSVYGRLRGKTTGTRRGRRGGLVSVCTHFKYKKANQQTNNKSIDNFSLCRLFVYLLYGTARRPLPTRPVASRGTNSKRCSSYSNCSSPRVIMHQRVSFKHWMFCEKWTILDLTQFRRSFCIGQHSPATLVTGMAGLLLPGARPTDGCVSCFPIVFVSSRYLFTMV